MFTQKIELMGLEYVLMLGAWWGAAVFLTVLVMATKRSLDRWHERRQDARFAIIRTLDN